MAFRVIQRALDTNQPVVRDFGDSASYSFHTGGVLVITDKGETLALSPSVWLVIEQAKT